MSPSAPIMFLERLRSCKLRTGCIRYEPSLEQTLSVTSVFWRLIFLRDRFSDMSSQKLQYSAYLSAFSFRLRPSKWLFYPSASPNASIKKLKSVSEFSATRVLRVQFESNLRNTFSRISGDSVEHYEISSVCNDLFRARINCITFPSSWLKVIPLSLSAPNLQRSLRRPLAIS